MSAAVYAIAIAQFLLGVLITVVNTLMVGVLITTSKLRKDVTHCLLTNMWFANLLLGVIIAVVNVVEMNGIASVFKAKGTITIINSFVSIMTLIILVITRMFALRTDKPSPVTVKAAAISVTLIWSIVVVITFIKAIVSSLEKYNQSACYTCFLKFEVATLCVLGILAIFLFIVTACQMLMKKKRGVTDSTNSASSTPKGQPLTEQKKPTIMVGIMLFVFVALMISYIIMEAVAIHSWIDIDASEIIICLFFVHCLINPMVLMCMDKEARVHLRRMVTCKGSIDETPQNQMMMQQQPIQMMQPQVLMMPPQQYPTMQPQYEFVPPPPQQHEIIQHSDSEIVTVPSAPSAIERKLVSPPQKNTGLSHIDTMPVQPEERYEHLPDINGNQHMIGHI